MSLSLKTEYHKSDSKIDYTNSSGSTITAGTPIQVASATSTVVGIPASDIADGDSDELDIEGRFRAVKKAETWVVGEVVGWDANGNPLVGAAGSGAYTNVVGDMDFKVGSVALASDNATEQGVIALNEYPANIAATVAAVTTANGSDAATTQALANQLKTTVNAILTNLKAAKLMS